LWDVVVKFLSSVVVLTPNGQLLDCTTIGVSEGGICPERLALMSNVGFSVNAAMWNVKRKDGARQEQRMWGEGI
jgi:hypothetical protein